MKRISKRLLILGLITLSLMLSGCLFKSRTGITALPFQAEEGGKWGFVNLKGDVVVRDIYDNQPSIVSQGIFYLKNAKGKYNFYRFGKSPKIFGTDYISVGLFREGLAPVAFNNNQIFYINRKGKPVIQLKNYQGQQIVKASTFNEGRAVIQTITGKYGFINSKGNIVIPPVYDDVSMFSEGLAIVVRVIDSQKLGLYKECGFIDKNGSLKIPFQRDVSFGSFSEGLASIQIKDTDGKTQTGLINRKGKQIVEVNADFVNIVGKVKNGYVAYSDGEKYGLLNRKGIKIIRPRFDMMFNLNGVCMVVSDGKYGIFSFDGEPLLRAVYQEICPLSKKVFILRSSKKYFFADIKGRGLNNRDYATVSYSDYIQICLNNYYQSVSLDYTPITEKEKESSKHYLYPGDIKSITATSSQANYQETKLFDDDRNTAWVEDEQNDGVGVSIQYTFSRPLAISSIKIVPGYDGVTAKNDDTWQLYNRLKKLRLDFSDGNNTNVLFDGKTRQYDIPLKDIQTSFVKMTILEVYPSSKNDETAISEITFSYIE